MAKIQRLPVHIANQIAAGEVIERPASVVKELVENSLDAGARRITVEVSHGGQHLRITDDGAGMSEEDALLAFERFATSKLTDTEQLWALTTNGFRGEALASIASVAKVECLTREKGSDRGVSVTIHGGGEPQVKPAGCPEGTTLVVEELFYNTPARLKFLRAAGTEQGHIADVVTSLALAHPQLDFKLVVNGRESLSTVGARSLRETAARLLGDDVASELLEVDFATETGRVKGLVSRPSRVRADRSRQWFFINGRWVRHPMLAKSVEEAFAGHIPSDRHPIFVLAMDLDPGMVDVNVHPAKKEVRLGNTYKVFSLVRDGIVRAFTQAQAEALPGVPATATQWPGTPSWDPSLFRPRPFDPGPSTAQTTAALGAYAPMPALFESTPAYGTPGAALTPGGPPQAGLPRELDGLRVIAQLHRTYIMCEHPEGLFLIDQHNSHERWVYEQLGPASIVSQELLLPVVMPLSASERASAAEHQERLRELGFSFEPLGPDDWMLRAIPALLPLEEAERTVRELLSGVEATGVVSRMPDDDPVRRTIACHSAVRAGDVLSLEQMEQIIERLKETKHPLTCPHGRPTGIMISMAELNRRCLRS